MSWLRLDDGFTRHPKVFALTAPAFRLHVTALCYCAANLTDGKLDKKVMPVLLAEAKATKRYVAELVEARLWTGVGPWEVKDYLDYNPSSEEVKEKRRQAAERQARHRDVTRDSRVSHASPVQPSPTHKDHAVQKLLGALTDRDDGTLGVIMSIVLRGKLTEGDLMWALECATGPGVKSPTAVAVAALKERAA